MSLFAQTAGSTTIPFTSQLTQDEPGVFSTGGIVFFVVLAVLIVGAGLLYLRNRNQSGGVRS
jgi:uncharacterized ion transporter superfamily protein YfcC